MEMLDRYLHAVEFWLPKTQRKDIVAELSEDLRSEIEENEAKLGRRLNEDELAGILRKRGNPVAVASRYAPSRPLIGPERLPVYWFVMKLVLLWILVPAYIFVIGPISVATSSDPVIALIGTLWTFLLSETISAGIITAIFVAVDRSRASGKHIDEWDPRRLPRIRSVKPNPRSVAFSEVLTAAVISLLFVMSFQSNFELNGIRIALTPIFRILYWPTLLVLLSGLPVGAVTFWRPDAIRLRAGIRVAAHLLTLAIVGVMLVWGSWVEISAPMFRPTDVAQAEKWTNFSIWITLLIIGFVTLFELIGDVRRLFDRPSGGSLKLAVM